MGTTRGAQCPDNGHHGQVTATQAWPTRGPVARDELAAWSTAALSDTEPGAVPGFSDLQPPGWTELVAGRGMYVRRRPGPADATPAWYIHGLAGSSTNWTRLAAALSPAATGYSVDLPGHVRSDPPPRDHYSLCADAELIAATIEQVSGGPVHLVGNSFGGIIATLLAAAHPGLIRSLTLISPAVPDLRLIGDRGADPRLGLLLVPGTAGNGAACGSSSQSGVASISRKTRSAPAIAISAWLYWLPMTAIGEKNKLARKKNWIRLATSISW